MKRSSFFSFLPVSAFLSFFATLYAQPPDSLWSHTYGEIGYGLGYEICQYVEQTSDGGYILAGKVQNVYCTHGYDIWLVRTDAEGNILWHRTYGNYWNDDDCCFIHQTADSGFVFAGTIHNSQGKRVFWLCKTGASGDSVWSHTFSVGDSECRAAAQTRDGGYVSVGRTVLPSCCDWDGWMVKTAANGDSLWSCAFPGVSDWWDFWNSVTETSEGGYILAGQTASWGAGLYDFWLAKTDENGNTLWSRTFGEGECDRCTAVLETPDGGYLLAGNTDSFAHDWNTSSVWLIRIDENGDSLWSRRLDGPYYPEQGVDWDWCTSLIRTLDGGYVFGGETKGHTWYKDFWLMKVNENGDSLWNCTFGGDATDGCTCLRQTTDGGFILAGNTESFGAGLYDFWLVKTGPELSVERREKSLLDEYALHQNWPNPFNPQTTIAFDVKQAGQVRLIVFNLLGHGSRLF